LCGNKSTITVTSPEEAWRGYIPERGG
jgi:hypothetical protein